MLIFHLAAQDLLYDLWYFTSWGCYAGTLQQWLDKLYLGRNRLIHGTMFVKQVVTTLEQPCLQLWLLEQSLVNWTDIDGQEWENKKQIDIAT